jgi:hypothetical protein
MSLAAVLVLAIALVIALNPSRSITPPPAPQAVVKNRARDAVPAPTLAAYETAAVFDPDKLDALLMKQSSCMLPPTPELTLQQP